MAGIKNIPTYTTIAAIIPDVDITTFYLDPEFGDIFNVFLNEDYVVMNGSPILEGYGVVIASDNMPSQIDIEVDNNGNMIIIGDEANKYNIDSDGNLTYTT